ncbi:hypothetical protein EHQ53_12105 [Leptospira langatensis]|uniref:Lipoprotein n=1 Tax=Leptospira langatensis TaxID=2484983 RepID=A0ABY2MB50_9LEPT|nr:hypothetical protein EHQ53_12105 [Leptospira langatensis]
MKPLLIIALLLAFVSCASDSSCFKSCDHNFSVCLLLTKDSKNPLGVYYYCQTLHDTCLNTCYPSGTGVRPYRGGNSRGSSE